MNSELLIGASFVSGLSMMILVQLASYAIRKWRRTILFQPGDPKGARRNIVVNPKLLQIAIDEIVGSGTVWLKVSDR